MGTLTDMMRWRYWACSVTGPSHLKQGMPNQDAWIVKRFRDGEVVVVADGLGSKPHSDVGSQAACKAVVDATKYFRAENSPAFEKFPRLVHCLWLLNLGGYDPGDCATTCLFVVRLKDCFILGQIGDGMITALGQTAESDFILQPSANEFSNLTDCLKDEYRDQWTLRMVPREQYKSFILCTDGISDDLVPERRIAFSHEICDSFREVPPVKRSRELRRCLTEWTVPNHSDDKTIACLYQ